MNKLIAAFALAVLLVPQASFAAWAYKGVPIKPGTDAEIAAQLAAIDAGTVAPESPSIAEQIAVLVAQIEILQAQLAALQGQTGGTITPMPEDEVVTPEPAPEEPAIDRTALAEERQQLEDSINWRTCKKGASCTADIERINEITKILGYGCTYELTKGGASRSCGG